MKKLFIGLFLLVSTSVIASENVPEMSIKNGYVEPFQMFDNVYYVGDRWVSSYAVETTKGLVLIDTLDFPYSMWIPTNLEKLGLQDKAITHILVTHGHSDHAGGAQYLQSEYDSKVVMTQKGYELAISQANKSSGNNSFLPPKVDFFVQDSSSLIVGGDEFKFYLTPGHTEGDYSIDLMVKDEGIPHRAFVVGGHSINARDPKLAKQFFESMDRVREIALQPPVVSVNLSNHPHKNHLFANREKRNVDGSNNPFISESNFFRFLEQQEALAKEKLGQAKVSSFSTDVYHNQIELFGFNLMI
ncbi:metallo-beta-lactamase [Vibrionales bacterium SWAT-3]|nr:metallo-beta-lactamase [Vibrionales bacterium SWAT-3]